MSLRSLTLVVVVSVLPVVGCTIQEPEFSANDQVPAEQRTTEEAAAGGQQQPAQAAGTWVVEGNDLKFDQAPTMLPAGEVTIGLDNKGGLPHNVVFEGVQGDKPIVNSEGNDSDTGKVTLQAGTFTYYCSIPGHRGGGMEGTVTVQ